MVVREDESRETGKCAGRQVSSHCHTASFLWEGTEKEA